MRNLFLTLETLLLSLCLFLTVPLDASDKMQKPRPIQAETITVVKPKPFAISTNIVFVVDASSTINRYGNIKRRFDAAWDHITNRLALDELYFSVYVFHDKNREKFRDWVNAGGH